MSSGVDENEEEEALVALIEHRTKELDNYKNRFKYYKTQIEQAEKKLRDLKSELAQLRSRDRSMGSQMLTNYGSTDVKPESIPLNPASTDEGHSPVLPRSKPKLLITGVQTPRNPNSIPSSPASTDEGHSPVLPKWKPKLLIGQTPRNPNSVPSSPASTDEGHSPVLPKSKPKLLIGQTPRNPNSIPSIPASTDEGHSPVLPKWKPKLLIGQTPRNPNSIPSSPASTDEGHSSVLPQSKPQLLIPAVRTPQNLNRVLNSTQPVSVRKREGESFNKSSSKTEIAESKGKGRKRKLGQKQQKEVIPLIRSSESPCLIRFTSDVHISGQHKRKLRSLVLNPFDDELFVTCALDGFVNHWQVQSKGSGACLLSTTDCVSPRRSWPEDIAWHPQGDSLFCVYTADDEDAQVSILNLSASQQEKKMIFLEEKPHLEGIINSISFMPWDDSCFVTGGSDNGVVIWRQKGGENSWKAKALHRNLHTSNVMGVAGLQQKQIVMSAGVDKRIVGYDIVTGRADFRHQIESECFSVLPNPSDFNLFMVQAGTPRKQLRLYDIRLKQTEIHEFGWEEESTESLPALIKQAWSPDGLYISSGSADPMIHIFDIRYTANVPSQSVKAHQSSVFKAVWHNTHPLLISISSDLQIGFHKIA